MKIRNTATLVLALGILSTFVALANEDFERWMQQQQTEFQEYRDKRDKEFTAFLKQNWREVDLLKGVKRDEAPKPVRMPVAEPAPTPPVSRDVPVTPAPSPQPQTVAPPTIPVVPVPGAPVTRSERPVPVTPQAPKVVAPEPVLPAPAPSKPVPPPVIVSPRPVTPPPPPVTSKPAQNKHDGRKAVISYFGDDITLYYDPALKVTLSGQVNKKLISDTWSRLSRADFEPIVEQLNAIRDQRRLNDWAFAVLVDNFSRNVAGSGNSRTFLNWFILIKSDFQARVAYDTSTITLLVPTRQKLYGVSYFTLDGTKYYAVNFEGGRNKLGRVYTYDGKYPGATDAFDMRLTSDMIDTSKDTRRKLSFDFDRKQYEIEVWYDRERVSFLNSYPQLDLDMYFASKVADNSARSLQSQLAEHIEGMTELDAVNFLLRFVQTSFEYKTDDENFGEENYLFPEETLHYRYSDCEDRSVLFAWLVRNLLGLETIGLDYPGHVAVAVNFKGQVKGDAVTWKGRRFVVTDPTYINAVAGMTMPQFRSTNPSVIQIL